MAGTARCETPDTGSHLRRLVAWPQPMVPWQRKISRLRDHDSRTQRVASRRAFSIDYELFITRRRDGGNQRYQMTNEVSGRPTTKHAIDRSSATRRRRSHDRLGCCTAPSRRPARSKPRANIWIICIVEIMVLVHRSTRVLKRT